MTELLRRGEAAAFRVFAQSDHFRRIRILRSLIEVPRFELGTSPTRTERATRLRHTERSKGSDNRRVAQRDEIIRFANELLEVDRFPGTGCPACKSSARTR